MHSPTQPPSQPTDRQNFDWDDLLDDIEEQNAVLLLGHGFLPGAQAALGAQLQEKLNSKLLHSYSREALFLFADSEAKTTAQKEAARYYRGVEVEESILQKMAEMPFPIIISANPDKLLLDTFARYRLPCQFDYFSSQYKIREYTVERPNRDKPLLYNLCGSHEDKESLLLDYDDLFQMLKVLLSDLTIPNEVRMPLLKTTTYIFVGFHFERWYTQLFLRYLNMNDNRFSNNSRNYALKTTFSDPSSQEFFLRQFNVKYIGAGYDLFDELHKRFSTKYPQSLRQLVDTLSPTATTVIQLVARDDLPAAFQMMKIFTPQLDPEDHNLLTMTESDYARYLKLKAAGATDQRDLNLMIARVKNNLINLAKKLP